MNRIQPRSVGCLDQEGFDAVNDDQVGDNPSRLLIPFDHLGTSTWNDISEPDHANDAWLVIVGQAACRALDRRMKADRHTALSDQIS